MLPIVYSSNEQGAPVLNNAAGSLISVLDAVLVNGFNTVGIFSITITDNVATVVTSAGHGLAVGNRITVAGVSITAATGEKVVASIINSTTFTFSCVNANNTESPVSATIKRTPLGFAKIFNKTNVGMYKSLNVQAYGQALRVDDTNATGSGARVFAVENPTSIDAWGDKYPTELQLAGGLYWPKSSNDATAKAWCLVGDDRFFYLLVAQTFYSSGYYPNSSGGYCFSPYFFGDIVSYKQGESFGAIIGGCSAGTGNTPGCGLTQNTRVGAAPSTSYWSFIARQQSSVQKSIRIAFCHPGGASVVGDTSSPRYPSPVDNGLVIAEPSLVLEDLAYALNPIRGILPGFATFLAYHSDLPNAPLPQKMTTTDGSNREYLFAPWTISSTPNSPNSLFAVKLSEAWR